MTYRTLGLIITNRGSLVSKVAAPEATTTKRLSHSIVSIRLPRANCTPICATPSATPSVTDNGTFLVSRKRTRKKNVDAMSRSSNRADWNKILMSAKTHAAGHAQPRAGHPGGASGDYQADVSLGCTSQSPDRVRGRA